MQLWTHCSKILFFFRHSPWRAHFFEIIHALRIKDTKYKVHLEWVKVGVLWEGYIFFCEMTIFFQVLIVMTEDVFFHQNLSWLYKDCGTFQFHTLECIYLFTRILSRLYQNCGTFKFYKLECTFIFCVHTFSPMILSIIILSLGCTYLFRVLTSNEVTHT